MDEIVIVGCRGLGKEVIGYVEETKRYKIVAILDQVGKASYRDYPIIHPDNYKDECRRAIFAVGYPIDKEYVLDIYKSLKLSWVTFVHPMASVSPHAHIGIGSIIAPFAVVAGNCKLGDFVLANSFSSIGHDSSIGSFTSLMPYACVAGKASVSDCCLLSIGVKVMPEKRIHENTRISAGTIVSKDIPSDSLAFGNPLHIVPDIDILKLKKQRGINNGG